MPEAASVEPFVTKCMVSLYKPACAIAKIAARPAARLPSHGLSSLETHWSGRKENRVKSTLRTASAPFAQTVAVRSFSAIPLCQSLPKSIPAPSIRPPLLPPATNVGFLMNCHGCSRSSNSRGSSSLRLYRSPMVESGSGPDSLKRIVCQRPGNRYGPPPRFGNNRIFNHESTTCSYCWRDGCRRRGNAPLPGTAEFSARKAEASRFRTFGGQTDEIPR